MAQELFFDKAVTTVSSGGTTAPAAGTTETWTVASSATFVDYNALTASSSAFQPRQFRVVDPADTSTVPEIILVTNVSGTTWSVTRGAEGTTPFAHASGFTVKAVPTSASLGAGKSTFFDFTVNDYMLLSAQTGTGAAAAAIGTTATNSNNRVLYVPFRLGARRQVASLAQAVIALNAGASAVLRLGLYADTGAGRPGAVVQDAGTASINTAGLKELTFTALVLEPGLYWAAVATQSLDTAGANPTLLMSSTGTAASTETAPAATTSMLPIFLTTGVTGAFANNPSVTIGRNNAINIPHVWMKVTG